VHEFDVLSANGAVARERIEVDALAPVLAILPGGLKRTGEG